MGAQRAVLNLFSKPLTKYGLSVILACFAVLVRSLLSGVLEHQSPYGFLLPVVLICAVYGGVGAGLTATIVGSFLTVLWIVPPSNTLQMTKSELGALALFLTLCLGVLWLTHRELRERARRISTEKKLEHANQVLEQTVAERTSELRAANDELEGFCYSMAHDLRTPTRAIAGNARIMLEDHSEALNPELRDHLYRINRSALKLGSLVDGLLIYARLAKQDLHPTEVFIGKIVTEIATIESKRAKIPVALEVDESLLVRGDERQVRILVKALVDNSLTYRRPGLPAKIRLYRSGNGIAFADEGLGFEMRYAHKVFLPFERLYRDDEFPGVGMGLANVDRVVKRHGGTVSIDSALNEGTVVRLHLPGIQPAAPELIGSAAAVR